MKLYQKKKNSINVFSLECNNNDVAKYKEENINKIPEKERLLVGLPKNDRFIYPDNDRLIIPENKNKEFYLLENKSNNNIKNTVFNLYFCDTSNSYKTYKSDYLKIIKYYLVYNSKVLEKKKNIGSIIQVPECLYDLQLILNNEFKLLKDKNIDEILELFSLEKVDEIDINSFKGNLEKILNKVKNDQILIKKMTRK